MARSPATSFPRIYAEVAEFFLLFSSPLRIRSARSR